MVEQLSLLVCENWNKNCHNSSGQAIIAPKCTELAGKNVNNMITENRLISPESAQQEGYKYRPETQLKQKRRDEVVVTSESHLRLT